MSAERFEGFIRRYLVGGPWQYADGESMSADAEEFCAELDALRAAQPAAPNVPWEAIRTIVSDGLDRLWPLYAENAVLIDAVNTWLHDHAPKEAQP